jgi:hypothetical protein
VDGVQQGMPAGTGHVGAQQHRKVAGLATAVTILILLALVGEVLNAVSDWRTYLVVHDYRAGAATMADVEAVDTFSMSVAIPALVTYIAAGVVFLIWLWRARINAELLGGPAAHRRSRLWVIWSWLTPVANLWFPYQIVIDISEASAMRRPVPRSLITAWWALWVASTIVGRAVAGSYLDEKITEQGLRSTANLSTVSTVLDLAAGGLIVLIIHRITTGQTQRLAQHQV